MSQAKFLELLQSGIVAAQTGNKLLARVQFEEALELNAKSAVAWTWLAWVADTPKQATAHLKKAAECNGSNPVIKAATFWLSALEQFKLEAPAKSVTATTTSATATEEIAKPVTLPSAATVLLEPASMAAAPVTAVPATAITAATSGSSVLSATKSKAGSGVVSVFAKTAIMTKTELGSGIAAAAAQKPQAGKEPTSSMITASAAAAVRSAVAAAATKGMPVQNQNHSQKQNPPTVAPNGELRPGAIPIHLSQSPPARGSGSYQAPRPVPTATSKTIITTSALPPVATGPLPHQTLPHQTQVRQAPPQNPLPPNAQPQNALPPMVMPSTPSRGPSSSHIAPNPMVLAAQAAEVAAAARAASKSTIRKAPPVEITVRPDAGSASSKVTDGPHVLMVDDSPTLCKVVSSMLGGAGYRVSIAHDGMQALELVGKLQPDLILLDIMMPNLDGYEVCKRLKADPATKGIPIVMLSGKDGFFDKARGKMAGCDQYLTKPFTKESLLGSLRAHAAAETNR